MPRWEYIEDSAATPTRVWFFRSSSSNPKNNNSGNTNVSANDPVVTPVWKPLRKVDCHALNNYLNNSNENESANANANESKDKDNKDDDCVYIDGRRQSAFPKQGIIRHNYRPNVEYELCSACWFRREPDNNNKKNEVILIPITAATSESDAIEHFYQRVVAATSSLGKGLASVANESVVLSTATDGGDRDQRKSTLHLQSNNHSNKSSQTLKLVLKDHTKKSWLFVPQFDLQRGYGEYTVEGEDEELQLGPVAHVVFAIHGIGEAFFSQPLNNMPSIVDEMLSVRNVIQKQQVADYHNTHKQQQQRASTSSSFSSSISSNVKKNSPTTFPLPLPPDRIEFIPIEWYSGIHDASSMLMQTLRATTLPSIPMVRSIANDIVFDVLMYMTPHFCQAVLEFVTHQISVHYATFLRLNPEFNGKFSLIGHSLGSVICWDLLSILKLKQEEQGSVTTTTTKEESGDAEVSKHEGTWGPTLVRTMDKTLPFMPECTIFLGSPLGLFLTLRGAHAVFDSLRTQRQQMTLTSSPFALPTNSLYNIFNASDPVAYRIEPLLLSPTLFNDKHSGSETTTAELPPPVYLTAIGKDVRLHVKARQMADELQKAMKEAFSVSTSSSGSITPTRSSSNKNECRVAGNDDLDVSNPAPGPESPPPVIAADGCWPPVFALGCPKHPKRVDYSFQPALVENEYLNAVTAHSSYFSNVDFLEFLVSKLTTSSSNAVSEQK